MAYRDQVVTCPRCGAALLRRHRRDLWRCPGCRGIHLSEPELERWLRVVAPDVAGEVLRAVRGRAAPRADDAPLPCPTCQRPMSTMVIAGVAGARCAAGAQLWFDGESLGRLLLAAEGHSRARRSWIARLLAHLFAS